MNNTSAPISISQKAYNDFVERIHSVFGNNDIKKHAKEVIELMDNYLSGNGFNLSDYEMIVRIAFSMILPEIEKAAARSRKAKEAAAKRRKRVEKPEKPRNSTPEIPNEAVVVPSKEAISQTSIKPNRAERRFAEQNERREKRRLMRQLSKWRKEFQMESKE